MLGTTCKLPLKNKWDDWVNIIMKSTWVQVTEWLWIMLL